jgi:hypothetical protein
LLTVPVSVITPPDQAARSLTAQAKFGPPLVSVMRTPPPTVLLVTSLIGHADRHAVAEHHAPGDAGAGVGEAQRVGDGCYPARRWPA